MPFQSTQFSLVVESELVVNQTLNRRPMLEGNVGELHSAEAIKKPPGINAPAFAPGSDDRPCSQYALPRLGGQVGVLTDL